jgi:hypothetical protein
MSRTRSRVSSQVVNDFTLVFPTFDHFTETTYLESEVCVDSLDPKTDHPLTLTHDQWSGMKFNWQGTYLGTGQLGYPAIIPTVPSSGLASWLNQFTASKIVAATAPLRPTVYPITNMLEFRDVPRMLKHAGDLLLNLWRNAPNYLTKSQNIASSVLAWQFGWWPIIQDLQKICDFGQLVDKRLELLGALNSGKTVRRKVKFGNYNEGVNSTVTLHSTGGVIIQPKATLSSVTSCWATVHWSLAPNQYLAGLKPTWLDAFKSVYGLTPLDMIVQVWKALPWSWLIDWFANLSEALENAHNLLFYVPSRINKMWLTSQLVTYDPLFPTATRKFYGGTLVRTIKNRTQPSVQDVLGVRLNVPFLDAFKLSVLGSLTIVKLARR